MIGQTLLWGKGRASTLGAIALLIACYPVRGPIVLSETSIGTNTPLSRLFHSAVLAPDVVALDSPGFVIGIEKAPRAKIGAEMPKPHEIERLNRWATQTTHGGDELDVAGILDDGKPTLVTHIMASRRVGEHVHSRVLYSWYGDWHRGVVHDSTTAWTRGKQALVTDLSDALWTLIEEEDPTHVLLFNFGWENDQAESIHRTNRVVAGLKDAAASAAWESGDHRIFNPIVLLTTWPSRWRIKYVSVANKANDADEVGLLWVNRLLHTVLDPQLRSRRCLPLIAIGHSFGARILTRAMFSRSLVDRPNQCGRKTPVDLLIAIQGAFSIHRFGSGSEGAPYRRFKDLDARIVLTSSEHDSANSKARWSLYAGSARAFKAAGDKEHRKHFLRAKVDSGQQLYRNDGPRAGSPVRPEDWKDRILYIDATASIGGHGDFMNKQWYKTMWQLIAQTPMP